MRHSALWAVTVGTTMVMMIAAPVASAWKPATHLYAGAQAYQDATDGDGSVTIHGRQYPIPTRVVDALRATDPNGYPRGLAYYNLGVIGPDGMPDLVYGQSIIHPGSAGDPGRPYPFTNSTGAWMQYVYHAAWAAQVDPAFGGADRQNILAFAYGYLTHAAGDMWGHTFVNDFAGGVFPAFSDLVAGSGPVPTRVIRATENVLRHVIVEGYVGAATPGIDHNTDEAAPVCPDGNAPNIATSCLDRGQPDYSDNTTPGVVLPTVRQITNSGFEHWMYKWMISTTATTPAHDQHRGLLLDLFINLRRKLDAQTHQPSQTAAAVHRALDDARSELTSIRNACRNWNKLPVSNAVRCAKAIGVAVIRLTASAVSRAINVAAGVVADAENALLNLYRYRWISDIDKGLQHWPEFGLATSRALFDPQIRRDVQNDTCFGSEGSAGRNACEEGFGALKTVTGSEEVHGFIHNTDYGLLVMAGFPDWVVGFGNFLDHISQSAKDVLRALGPFNPLVAKDAIEEAIKSKIEDFIKDTLNVDIPGFENFYRHPGRWVCGDVNQSVTLPIIGTLTAQEVFPPGTQARLEGLMGLGADESTIHEQVAGLPLACGPLKDDVEVDPATFRALGDTVTMSQLALLSGGALDKVFGDELTAEGVIKDAKDIITYNTSTDAATGEPLANVMIDGLSPNSTAHTAYSGAPYLRLIDGDHAWRHDGLPRFCNNGDNAGCADGATAREPRLNGGAGTFPPFASCVIRPSFSHIFANWENHDGSSDFRTLGDPAGRDASAPAPFVSLSPVKTSTDGLRVFVGADNRFNLQADSATFARARLRLYERSYKEGQTPPATWTSIPNDGQFSLPADATDGIWHIDYAASDPCSPSADGVPSPDARHTESFILDSTPPTLQTAPADGATFTTDQTSTLTFSADDDGGSGVAFVGATLDANDVSDGHGLDMFHLDPGTHTISVRAHDHIGNDATRLVRFGVHATIESMLSNITRSCAEGLITFKGLCKTLPLPLRAARHWRERGRTRIEAIHLRAFSLAVRLAAGRLIDAATAARLIAYTKDLIARGG